MRMGDEAFSEAEKELLEGNPLIPTYGSMVPLSLSNSRSSKQLYRAMIKKEIQNDVITTFIRYLSRLLLLLSLHLLSIVSRDGDAASSREGPSKTHLSNSLGIYA